MAKSIQKKYITVITREPFHAIWPKITEVGEYEGKQVGYSVSAKFSEAEETRLIALLDAEWEKWKREYPDEAEELIVPPLLGYKKDKKEGGILFTFKQNHEYKDKKGVIHPRIIPLFDAKGKPTKVAKLGGGSLLHVNFQVVPFYMSERNAGLSLKIQGIQILELKSGERDAASLGFGAYDDYDGIDAEEQSLLPQEAEDVPNGERVNGDF